QSAKPMAGEEAAVFERAASLSPTMPFRDLIALRTRVNNALRAERRGAADTVTLARLSRLRDGIEDATSATVEQRAAQAPEILDGLGRFEQFYTADRNRWQ